VAVVLEYEDVLSRPGILPTLSSANVRVVLDHLCSTATHQEVYFIWRPQLPDSGDDLFLELAIAAQAPYIITHNLNDFRGSKYFSVNAITPKQALQLI
jgi:predicted nucleic acid-binding protein